MSFWRKQLHWIYKYFFHYFVHNHYEYIWYNITKAFCSQFYLIKNVEYSTMLLYEALSSITYFWINKMKWPKYTTFTSEILSWNAISAPKLNNRLFKDHIITFDLLYLMSKKLSMIKSPLIYTFSLIQGQWFGKNIE